GLPNVVLEAMAVGSPVVCTDITGIRDFVRDGVNGLLVEPRNSQKLASCVLRILDSVALADGLSRAASETVRGYRWGQVAARVEVEYLQMLETIRARSSAKARRRGIKTT
ncbi:MAG: glycosyltransferase, partial [Dehalococcoidia bacterium]